MISALKASARMALQMAIDQCRVQATLTRLDGSEVCIRDAGLGQMMIEAESVDGKQIRVAPSDARDLLTWPDQLRDQPPVAGELVEITFENRQRRTFEIAAALPDPCWRWTDRFETGMRIHMKEY